MSSVLKLLENYNEERPDDSATAHLVIKQAREWAMAALTTLHEIAQDGSAGERERIMAANSILDRAMGKPAQYVHAQTTSGSYKDLLHLIDRKEQILLDSKSEREITVHDVLEIKVLEDSKNGEEETTSADWAGSL